MSLLALAVLYLELTISLTYGDLQHAGCIKVNRCQCLMRDGSGLVDLSSVAEQDGFLFKFKPLRFLGVDADAVFSFSPCLPFSQPEDVPATDCTGVAVCVNLKINEGDRIIDEYLNYGKHEGNTFSYNDSQKMLSVSYSCREPLTVVHFRCSSNHSVIVSVSESGCLQVWVESPCACPSACTLPDVGPGNIIVILLCLSITVYFIT
ncbi:hypothetical protein DNTS_026984, partial [Danionella cerebrum]